MFKTQEFRTKDFFVRRAHSIEHQKCKYCQLNYLPVVVFERGTSLSFIYGIHGRENLFS